MITAPLELTVEKPVETQKVHITKVNGNKPRKTKLFDLPVINSCYHLMGIHCGNYKETQKFICPYTVDTQLVPANPLGLKYC